VRRAGLAAAAVALATASCGGLTAGLRGHPGPDTGLVRGLQPWRAQGVRHADRLTDGIAADPGDPARTDLTAALAGPDAYVVYDLGAAVPVRCVAVQAGGGDTLALSLSADGQSFVPLWTAAPADEPGMQLRVGRGLAGVGRYLRMSAAGAGASAAELVAMSDCPQRFPPPLAVQRGTPLEEAVRTKIALLAALALAYTLGYRRRAPDFVKLLVVAPLGVALALGVQLAELWPPPARTALELAGALAAVAAAVGLRVALARRRATS
jgi:hypothetical protein